MYDDILLSTVVKITVLVYDEYDVWSFLYDSVCSFAIAAESQRSVRILLSCAWKPFFLLFDSHNRLFLWLLSHLSRPSAHIKSLSAVPTPASKGCNLAVKFGGPRRSVMFSLSHASCIVARTFPHASANRSNLP